MERKCKQAKVMAMTTANGNGLPSDSDAGSAEERRPLLQADRGAATTTAAAAAATAGTATADTAAAADVASSRSTLQQVFHDVVSDDVAGVSNWVASGGDVDAFLPTTRREADGMAGKSRAQVRRVLLREQRRQERGFERPGRARPLVEDDDGYL